MCTVTSTIFSVYIMFLVVGYKISKPVNRAFFTGSEPVKNPVKWEFA